MEHSPCRAHPRASPTQTAQAVGTGGSEGRGGCKGEMRAAEVEHFRDEEPQTRALPGLCSRSAAFFYLPPTLWFVDCWFEACTVGTLSSAPWQRAWRSWELAGQSGRGAEPRSITPGLGGWESGMLPCLEFL